MLPNVADDNINHVSQDPTQNSKEAARDEIIESTVVWAIQLAILANLRGSSEMPPILIYIIYLVLFRLLVTKYGKKNKYTMWVFWLVLFIITSKYMTHVRVLAGGKN